MSLRVHKDSPNNPMFEFEVNSGSKVLYDCYMEECIEQFLPEFNESEQSIFF